MTSKKRRQRGSNTHGGGTHKNRRGAGNRGGRGRAGRKKHEFHNYESVGKSGFTRPPETQLTVEEVDLRRLDEDAPLLAADGLADETDEGYRIDVREITDPSADVDVIKVLGNTELFNTLTVIADEFSSSAIERLEASGGEAVRTTDDPTDDN